LGFARVVLKPEQLFAIRNFEREQKGGDLGEISPFRASAWSAPLHNCGLAGLGQPVSSKWVAMLLELL
jgi:hypothetical protein